MATLGDKSYNYNFYGLPDTSRVWGTPGAGGYAALTYLNMWGLYMGPPVSEFFTDGIYWEHDGIKSDTYGEPLDETVALWRISRNSSFACNAVFSAETGSILKTHYDVNTHPTDAPLAMCAVDTHGGAYGNFSTNPRNRWAYDVSNENNGSYSAMIYDIVYNTMCLQVNAITVNLTTPSAQPATRDLASLAAYIDGDTDNRFVQIIRPFIYRGASTPRYKTADGIPPQGAHTTYNGMPLIDTLTDRPIPSTETHLKDYIRDGHSERRDDVIYNPFVQRLEESIFTTPTDAADATAQLDIGFNRWLSMNNLRNGIRVIPDTTYRITAQYYRCNYDVKNFPDVSYQWENVVMNNSNGMLLPDGLDLTLLPSNTTFRIMTRLRIIDAKGNTIGKATELAVKHEIAFIGMYFCDTVARAENTVLGTAAEGVYLPLYTGGVPNGEYVTGDDIPLQPHANANSIADETFKYNPDESEESGDSSTIINRGTIGSGATYYALTNAQMNSLSTWLNTTYQPTDQDTFIQDFKGMNTADYIASCVFYPFDVPVNPGADVPIVVGKLTAGTATGRTLYYEYGNLYDYGYYDIPMFGDFRDYLTQITVFVPFCGTVKLDPIMWVGHRLSVKMAIDWPTGVCTGFIFRDNTMYDSVSGTIGVQLPLSAVANGSYQVAITNLLASHKAAHRSLTMGALGVAGGLATAAGGAATGNLKLAAGGLLSAVTGVSTIDSQADKMENIDYNIDHTQPSVTEVSGGSPFINCGTDLRVKILRTTPLMLPGYDASVYARTIGFADCRTVKNLSGESGLTVCTNIDTSGLTAPLEVIAELNKACKEGLIL